MTKTVLLTVNVHGTGPEAADTPEDRLFGRFAHGRYAYTSGLCALLDRLRALDVRATFFWPVYETLRAPAELERALKDGHEIACHGNAFEEPTTLGAEREAELLANCVRALASVTGQAPAGFRSPTGTLSRHTLPLLHGLGLKYDSSFIDDDAPYSLAADGAPGMVELPWSESLCDATHFRRRFTQDRAELAMHEELGPLLDADGYACITVHPRGDIGIARQARLPILERLVAFARRQGAEFALCREVAARARSPAGDVSWRGRPRPGLPRVDYQPSKETKQ